MANNLFNNLNNSSIFKYIKGEDYHFKSIKNNYFYFSRPDKEVNDPDDCKVDPTVNLDNISYHDIYDFLIRNSMPMRDAKYVASTLSSNKRERDDYIKKLEDDNRVDDENFRKKVKILCLTTNPYSYYMWSNYAKKINEMDGFCLGYNCQQSKDYKIINLHKTYKIDLEKNQINTQNIDIDHVIAVQVFYGDDLLIPYNPFLQNKNDLLYNYYYKKKKWASEEEYRCLLNDTMTFGKNSQELSYPPEILKSIIFGQNCSKKTIEEVKKSVSDNGNYNLKYYFSKQNTSGIIEIFPE